MNAFTVRTAAAALLLATGCSRPDAVPERPGSSAAEAVPAGSDPSFVNRVWAVAESKQVAKGDLRVFLSDGTLVLASAHATPALGTWRYEEGQLSITEEGQEYPVEIIQLTDSTFRIRIHGPGEPVEIRFEPAAQPPVIWQ